MNKEELAALLNSREYGEEMDKIEEAQAKHDGLVVVFGYSDDNMEFRGGIYEEVSCYDGGEFLVSKDRIVPKGDHSCDCDCCGYKQFERSAKLINAVWSEEGYSWIYRTDIPHATFDIMEDGQKFCRGIVFDLSSLN